MQHGGMIVRARLLHNRESNNSPIDEFLDGLDRKSQAKVAVYLSLLEE